MALFNRQDQSAVPEEIREYYQSERRERAGVAWLLAFGTLVVTVVLAAGIFFAGRWGYRAVFDKDKPETTEVAQQENKPAETPTPSVSQPDAEQERRKAEEEKKRQEAEAAKKAEEQKKAEEAKKAEEEKKRQEETARAQQQQQQPTAAAPSQPTGGSGAGATAGTSTTLTNTGPADIVGIFVSVTIAGYIMHRFYSRATNR